MRGFDEAVNGYFDVEGQLWHYLRRRAAEQFSNEREAKREIDSRDEFEARREDVRETFLAGIGSLPDRPADLAVERMGVVERNGYSIERLTFEGFRDFHVTANCYVPEGDGPHPGLLFCCGHVQAAKADPLNQKACIELALSGFVVLVFDPICQGEREQYRALETGEALVSTRWRRIGSTRSTPDSPCSTCSETATFRTSSRRSTTEHSPSSDRPTDRRQPLDVTLLLTARAFSDTENVHSWTVVSRRFSKTPFPTGR